MCAYATLLNGDLNCTGDASEADTSDRGGECEPRSLSSPAEPCDPDEVTDPLSASSSSAWSSVASRSLSLRASDGRLLRCSTRDTLVAATAPLRRLPPLCLLLAAVVLLALPFVAPVPRDGDMPPRVRATLRLLLRLDPLLAREARDTRDTTDAVAATTRRTLCRRAALPPPLVPPDAAVLADRLDVVDATLRAAERRDAADAVEATERTDRADDTGVRAPTRPVVRFGVRAPAAEAALRFAGRTARAARITLASVADEVFDFVFVDFKAGECAAPATVARGDDAADDRAEWAERPDAADDAVSALPPPFNARVTADARAARAMDARPAVRARGDLPRDTAELPRVRESVPA